MTGSGQRTKPRAVGRCGERHGHGWTMGACCPTTKGQKHIPRTDDGSARCSCDLAPTALGTQARIPEPMRLEMIYKVSSKQFRWTPSRGNICSTDAVQRLPSGT